MSGHEKRRDASKLKTQLKTILVPQGCGANEGRDEYERGNL
jgi:hypothetical protein